MRGAARRVSADTLYLNRESQIHENVFIFGVKKFASENAFIQLPIKDIMLTKPRKRFHSTCPQCKRFHKGKSEM